MESQENISNDNKEENIECYRFEWDNRSQRWELKETFLTSDKTENRNKKDTK